MTFDVNDVKFGPDGLVPVVAQSETTGDVLMLAWADRTALEQTVKTGWVHYHSRSRGRLWKKGEDSGHTQRVVSLHADCDGDAILALVHQEGPACHTNNATCFTHVDVPGPVLASLSRLIEARKTKPPAGSYTAKLLADPNLRAKKIGEEATELVMALRGEGPDRVASEAADVVYHLLVACAAQGVPYESIMKELAGRRS